MNFETINYAKKNFFYQSLFVMFLCRGVNWSDAINFLTGIKSNYLVLGFNYSAFIYILVRLFLLTVLFLSQRVKRFTTNVV